MKTWLDTALEKGLISKETVVDKRAFGTVVHMPPLDDKMSEREFQGKVIALAQDHGWKVSHFRKVRVQREDGSTYWETPAAADGTGFPDLCVSREGDLFFAELKVKKNKPTDEQYMWLHLIRSAGIRAWVWRPEDWDEITAVLSDLTKTEASRFTDDGNPHCGD